MANGQYASTRTGSSRQTVPEEAPPAARQPGPSTRIGIMAETDHILVVEDEPITREQLVSYFEEEGFKVSS